MSQQQRPSLASSMKAQKPTPGDNSEMDQSKEDEYVFGAPALTQDPPISRPAYQSPTIFEPPKRNRREPTSHATFNLPKRIYDRLKLTARWNGENQGEIIARALEKEFTVMFESDSNLQRFVEDKERAEEL